MTNDTGLPHVFTCSSETCIDPVTSLMWQKTSPDNGYLWQDAVDYCGNLDLLGHQDWRLPTIGQLRSLVRGCADSVTGGSCGVDDSCLVTSCRDISCIGCSMNGGPAGGRYWPNGLEGSAEVWYTWSSSLVADQTTDAWYVNFYYGGIGPDIREMDFYVRCVRGV